LLVSTADDQPDAVALVDVCREFRSRKALDGVSLSVRPREIHALLGPNGAGKTTLLRIAAGLTAPTSGRLEVFGHEVSSARHDLQRIVGVVPAGSRSFYQRISAIENLIFFGRLQGLPRRTAAVRARELLERVGLENDGRARVGEFSQGMERRLAIARALLSKPRVLLVDEATHDLDPLGADAIRRLVDELRHEGAAVIWATQRVDEVQGFGDRVTLLQTGRVRFCGSVGELVAEGAAVNYIVRLATSVESALEPGALARLLHGVAAAESLPVGVPGRFVLTLAASESLGACLSRLLDAGIDVLSCEHERPGVEQAFLTLTASAS
jgi:ABC-type multidrug transport system ATPase subunit